VCGSGLLALMGAITNLPRILTGLSMLLRFFLRVSYHLYAWVLTRLQPLAFSTLGLTLLAERPRTLASALLSLGLGWGLLCLLGWSLNTWWLLIFAAHGLLVGLAWDRITQPEAFQLGEKLP